MAWLYVSPLVLVLVPFFIAPIFVVVVASFLEHDGFGGMLPHFTLANYAGVFSAELTWRLYLSTVKFAVLTWAGTLVLGFWIAYFLVFHVRGLLFQIGDLQGEFLQRWLDVQQASHCHMLRIRIVNLSPLVHSANRVAEILVGIDNRRLTIKFQRVKGIHYPGLPSEELAACLLLG
jgi:hypothetical protein